jgi:peroxiredoxin Q/BCP
MTVSVLGVSTDTVESHATWKNKLGIPHPLLADTDHAVAERYGVWVEKTRPDGARYWGVARSTFLIDEDGRVFKVFPRVKVEGHSKEVLDVLRISSPPAQSPE